MYEGWRVMGTPSTISLTLNSFGNRSQGSYPQIDISGYVLSSGRYSPARYPLRVCYPRPDDETSPYAYHRIWQTGEPIDIPIEAQWGARPYIYKILSSPAGWTIGEWLVLNGSGDLVINDAYGTLSNSNPSAGLHTIDVGIWSADGSEFVRAAFSITFGNYGFYAAPADLGTGDGSTAANAMNFAAAYGNDDTLSPAKNKILYCRGGDYTLTNIPVAGVDKPRAVVNYRSEIPRFISSVTDGQMNMKSSDLMFKGIELVSFGQSAVFRTYGTYYERQAVWRCKIVDALGDPVANKNEAGWFIDRGSGVKRSDFLYREIEYVNCNEVAALDWYEVSGVITRQTWTTNKPEIEEPIWYPKAGNAVDMSYLVYDNVTATFDASVNGVIDIGNNEQYSSATTHTRFCYVRTISGGKAIGVNTSINASSVDNWIDHCTVVGGEFNARNYGIDDHVYVDRCVVVNSAAGVSDPDGGGVTATNLRGSTSGLVDANGRPLVAADVGLYGHVIRKTGA